jgi:hypothetical protein
MDVLVAPRVTTVSWSLYWKEALQVDTRVLDDVTVQLTCPATHAATRAEATDSASSSCVGWGSITGRDVLEAVAKVQGWPPVRSLHRIRGYNDPWERLLFRHVRLAI